MMFPRVFPVETNQQLAELYKSLTDDELLRLLAETDSLTDVAKQTISAEVARRGLVDDPNAEQRVDELRTKANTDREHSARRMNRWWRLGIFVLLGFAFASLWGMAMLLFRFGNALAVSQIATAWMNGNIGIWAFSNLLPGDWLTAKRTWLFGSLLNLAAFLGVFVVMVVKLR